MKTYFVEEGFERVTAGCPVPIVIAGGKKLWGPKRINNTCEYFASPIYADGKIYIAGENGYMVVLKSSDKLEILAKNDMGAPIVGTPAIADGRMIVRTRGHLYCVGLKK